MLLLIFFYILGTMRFTKLLQGTACENSKSNASLKMCSVCFSSTVVDSLFFQFSNITITIHRTKTKFFTARMHLFCLAGL